MKMDLLVMFSYFLSFLCLSACMPNGRGNLIPQNIVQFGNMISCATGLNQFQAMREYDGYGCFCGLGGSGTPLDSTDQCCVVHDNCYGEVMNSDLCLADNQVYAITYDYEWADCKTPDASITCKKAADYSGHQWPECAELMCECDRLGALCFAAERNTYNDNYKSHDKSTCK